MRALVVLLLLATPALAQTGGDASHGKLMFEPLGRVELLQNGDLAHGAKIGDPVHGRELFLRDNCYTCHGTTGAGGGALGGPRLAHAGLTPNAIINELRRPRAQMPAYSEKILTDAEAADIVAFIQSLSREPEPDAKNIKLLNQ